MDPSKTFPVIEIFGPVIQGEGIMAGTRTHFLRLGGCDFKCTWCDTMYAVDPIEVKKNATRMTSSEIYGSLCRLEPHGKILTISGGNPCMHDLDDLVFRLITTNWTVAVETQGTLWQDWVAKCQVVTISPKPPSSSMSFDATKFVKFVNNAAQCDTCIKVVVFTRDDFEFALSIREMVRAMNSQAHFYIQPGTNINAVGLAEQRDQILDDTRSVIEWVLETNHEDIMVMPQLHSLVYGSKVRGV